MIADSALRWALTAVFAVAALLFAGAGRRAPGQRGVGVLHAVASVGMIAMLWPAGMQVSPLLYVLVFTAGALYFAYLALFGFGLPHPVYHCTMMAAMALMGLLMAPNTGVPVAAAGSGAQASGHHSAHLGHGAIAVTPPAGSPRCASRSRSDSAPPRCGGSTCWCAGPSARTPTCSWRSE